VKNFPIVCVGGSAGGLDAYIRLLSNLPSDIGIAVVIVNHITRFPTHLHTILPGYTQMPVELITENLVIEPNHVYIIPENRDLHVKHGEFQLKPISKPYGWPDVITVFLRSLTRYWDGKLIAVIVSGFDGDGTAALCGIQQVGGITIAQTLDTASRPDMPESAIANGCIDFILSPEDIAKKLILIAATEANKDDSLKEITLGQPQLNKIDQRNNGMSLPHELDQMPDSQPAKPQPIMRQAYDDLQRGLVDTDMHGERGVEELLKGTLKISHKKKRSARK